MTSDSHARTEPSDAAAAKRERIKAISRTMHSIPVEEGGQLRPPKPTLVPPPPTATERYWKRAALTAGGVAGIALGFAAGLLAGRRRQT